MDQRQIAERWQLRNGIRLKMKLKPCPFCGANMDDSDYFQERNKWGVNCAKCLTRGPLCRKKEDAGKKWNVRPLEKEDETGN